MQQIAFLASSKISSESIMRCYDWATETAQMDIVVVSGFHSQLEKDVLHFLLKGHCRVKLVLGRCMYKKLPEIFIKPVDSGRLFISSISDQPRQTRESTYIRNRHIVDISDEVVIASLHPASSLYSLYEYAKSQHKKITLL